MKPSPQVQYWRCNCASVCMMLVETAYAGSYNLATAPVTVEDVRCLRTFLAGWRRAFIESLRSTWRKWLRFRRPYRAAPTSLIAVEEQPSETLMTDGECAESRGRRPAATNLNAIWARVSELVGHDQAASRRRRGSRTTPHTGPGASGRPPPRRRRGGERSPVAAWSAALRAKSRPVSGSRIVANERMRLGDLARAVVDRSVVDHQDLERLKREVGTTRSSDTSRRSRRWARSLQIAMLSETRRGGGDAASAGQRVSGARAETSNASRSSISASTSGALKPDPRWMHDGVVTRRPCQRQMRPTPECSRSSLTSADGLGELDLDDSIPCLPVDPRS